MAIKIRRNKARTIYDDYINYYNTVFVHANVIDGVVEFHNKLLLFIVPNILIDSIHTSDEVNPPSPSPPLPGSPPPTISILSLRFTQGNIAAVVRRG